MLLIIVSALGLRRGGGGGLISNFLRGEGMDVFWNDLLLPICQHLFEGGIYLKGLFLGHAVQAKFSAFIREIIISKVK